MFKNFLPIKDLMRREERIPFYKEVDLLAVEDRLLVGVTGRVASGFAVEGNELGLLDDAAIEHTLYQIRKTLNHIPEGMFLHFLVRVTRGEESVKQRYALSVNFSNPVTRVFLDKKRSLWAERPFHQKKVFLFLGLDPSGPQARSVFVPKLTSIHSRKTRALHREAFKKTRRRLKHVEDELLAAFSGMGIGLTRLDDRMLLDYLFTALNPDYAERVPEAVDLTDFRSSVAQETLRSRLIMSVPEVRRESFSLDGFGYRAVNLKRLPDEVGLRSLSDFESALPDEYLISMVVACPDQDRERGRIKRLGNVARSSSLLALTKNYEAIERHEDADRFLTELAVCEDQLLRFSMSVLVKSRDSEELNRRSDAALRAFPRLGGALGVVEDMNHDRLFLSSLPLQGEENPLSFTLPANALTLLLPVQDPWRGTEAPTMLLKTRSGEALRLDLFDPALPAKHALMIGTTGSGKSFFANYLLCHFLMASPLHHAVVIDVGGSYRRLAGIFSGSYLEVECSERYALNPFPRKPVFLKDNGAFNPDLMAFLTALLERMVGGKEKLSPVEARILERAILEAYRTCSGEAAPILSDVREVLSDYRFGDEEDRKKAYRFSKELAIWTEGRFGSLLNRPGTLDLANRFLVFDLSKLNHHPELQSILFFVIRGALTRKLEDITLKKIFVIDEGWRFFDDEVGSVLIQELYRTARKYNGMVLSVSQSPEDFIHSKASTAILANSYVKFALKLQKSHDILNRFEFNENEIKAVRSLEVRPGVFSEVFVKFFDRSVIARIEPTSLEYWMATTSPEDTVTEARERLAHPDWNMLGLLSHLSEHYPYGGGLKGKKRI